MGTAERNILRKNKQPPPSASAEDPPVTPRVRKPSATQAAISKFIDHASAHTIANCCTLSDAKKVEDAKKKADKMQAAAKVLQERNKDPEGELMWSYGAAAIVANRPHLFSEVARERLKQRTKDVSPTFRASY